MRKIERRKMKFIAIEIISAFLINFSTCQFLNFNDMTKISYTKLNIEFDPDSSHLNPNPTQGILNKTY